jgi:hypothetical protein
MHRGNACSLVDCKLLEASIAAGLTSAAQCPSRNSGDLQNWQLKDQRATEVTDLYATDTASAADAAAIMPVSTSKDNRDILNPSGGTSSTIGPPSTVLGGAFSQLRLARHCESTTEAVAAVGHAGPAAGIDSTDDHAPSSRRGLQQQQHEEELQAGGSVLPLAHFSTNLPSYGRLLCALAGQTQLTALQLRLVNSGKPAAGCSAALASLTSLQCLTLDTLPEPKVGSHNLVIIGMSHIPSHRQVVSAVESALQRLTRLTHLSLSWMPSNKGASLPTSLVRLQIGSTESIPRHKLVALQHLTRVTHLEVKSLKAKDVLPPSLRSLQVDDPLDLRMPRAPAGRSDPRWHPGMDDMLVDLDQLQDLQQLHLSSHPYNISKLQRLTGLTHLGLECRVHSGEATSAAVLASLPLRRLHLQSGIAGVEGASRRGFGDVLAQLGSYTHLTCLKLQELSTPCSVASLAGQLQGLPVLQELQLVRLRAQDPANPAAADPSVLNPAADYPEGGPAAPGGDPLAEVVVDSRGAVDSAWGLLFRAVPLLAPLRKLVVEGLPLQDDNVDALRAATQLTCLGLTGCGVSEAAAAGLQLALTHLLPVDGMLQIE